MTYYTGGKKRIGKYISDSILKYINDECIGSYKKIKGYCEPFCGMLGVYNFIPNNFKKYGFTKIKYKAGDRNPFIIKLWKGIKNGWKPPIKCSKDEFYRYKKIINEKKVIEKDLLLKCIFIGYACAYKSTFFGTFDKTKNIKKQSLNCIEIGKNTKNTIFKCCEYDKYSDLKGYIIYCDPPYINTQNKYKIGNKSNSEFNYKKFIEWCKKMSKNNIIFISEFTKPFKECKLIWSKGKEKLFVINNYI
jgi:site-specific DNA-adenine methylase